jgi:endonuclease G, mitochondrial
MSQSKISQLLEASERYEAAKSINKKRSTALGRRELVLERTLQPPAPTDVATAPAVSEARSRFLTAADRLALERRIGADDLKPIRFLELGLSAARSVGRLIVPNVDPRGDYNGTAFLIAPGVLITNHHMLEEPYWAEAARVEFGAEDDVHGKPRQPQIFRLAPDAIYYSNKDLDFAIVAVVGSSLQNISITDFGYIRMFPETGKIKEGEFANIIQHPDGRQKEICIRNNKLVVYNEDNATPSPENNFIYYDADTEGGSSGSPVFNDQWYLIALHRRSVPRVKSVNGRFVVMRIDNKPAREGDPDALIHYVANEGVRVSRIVKQLEAAAASGDPMGAKALERLQNVRVPPSAGPIASETQIVMSESKFGMGIGPSPFGLELIVRRESDFTNAKGFNENFLGDAHVVSLPDMAPELLSAAAPLKDGNGHILKYDNFSVVMNARRRMAFYAAWNIQGKDLFDPGSRPKWSYDPRMEDRFQPHDDIFSMQLNRGHIVRRKDVAWGPNGGRAHAHTFNLPNVLPQIHEFNDQEWGDLEDHILNTAAGDDLRVSVFAGPVFSAEDPFYDDLKRGTRGRRRRDGPTSTMRIPLVNWKIVAWVSDGDLKAAGFLRDQSAELEDAGPLEVDFGGAEQEQALISEISERTGLSFPGLAEVDTLAASGIFGRRPLGRPGDIIV